MLDSLTCQGTIQQTLIQMDSLNMHVIKPQGLPIITEDVRTPLPHHPTIIMTRCTCSVILEVKCNIINQVWSSCDATPP